MQNLNQLKWDYKILYPDTFSKDEQLLILLFLWREETNKNTTVVGD
jgi:hypothetical protein